MTESFSALLKKEQQNIEHVKLENPQFFTREPQIDDEAVLKQVGIFGLPQNRPFGYIKLWPQDFIVEEIDRDGKLHTIFLEDKETPKDEEGNTIYADLVKVGLSTIDVRQELSHALDLEEKFIGTAGIKDRDALTSQVISFRNIPKETIEKLSFPNFFLKNIRQGKGVVDKGMLQGNRFTITIRMKEDSAADNLLASIEDIAKRGFWNFYYLQRFGTPRLLTHIWGLYILRGEYEQAVKTIMTRQGAREVPFFKELRRQAEAKWGDWQAMEEIFNFFPLSFRSERKMLQYLAKNSTDFCGALKEIPQQLQLGIYAYSSFLFNSLLSSFIQRGEEPPSALPLFLSRNREDQNLYKNFFEKHNLHFPSPAFRDFPFVQWAGHLIPTRMNAEVWSAKVAQKNMAIVDFSLPKGAYATTFLTHFFTLASGLPVLGGIEGEKVDALNEIGRGTLGAVLERFKDVIFAKLEQETGADTQE